MEKKFSRIAALAISFILLVSVFSGCAGNKSGNDSSSGSAGSTQASSGSPSATPAPEKSDPLSKYEPKSEKVYEISYLTSGYGPVDPNCEVVQTWNRNFNVKLNPVWIDPNKFDDLLNIKFASNDIPDVINCQSVNRLAQYVDQKLLAEVPVDLMKKYAPKVVDFIDKDNPANWNLVKINGKFYGIPYINGAVYNMHEPIIWRDDWLKNVGINKLPSTFAEYEDAFTKFVNNDPDKNKKDDTYALSSSGFSVIFSMFGANNYINNKDASRPNPYYWRAEGDQMLYGPIQPGTKSALEVLARWNKQGLIDPEWVTGENKGGYWALSNDFVNGRIGFTAHGTVSHWIKKDLYPGQTADAADITELIKINPAATTAFGPAPVGPDGKTKGVGHLNVATGQSTVFSRNLDKEPDKLGKIMQMYNWPEESMDNWLFNWGGGTKGTNWDYKQVGTYNVPKRQVTDYVEQAKVGMASFFFNFSAANNKLTFPTFFEYFEGIGYDKDGYGNALTVSLPSTVKYQSDLDKLTAEMFVKIISGEKPIDYWDEYVKAWKEQGGDEILKEANEWYKSNK